MKKTALIITLGFFIMTTFPGYSLAQEETEKKDERSLYVSIGFTTYYSWWKSNVRQRFFGYTDRYNLDSSDFVYGPTLSLQGKKGWGFTANFLYGYFDDTYRKFDGDLIISYRIKEWMKFYFGGKYLGYTGKGYLHNSGLGTGLAFTVRLYKGLYLLPNISGLCLGGIDDIDTKKLTLGANGVIALAYYITKIRTMISAGVRYQYLSQVYTTFASSLTGSYGGKDDDQFYGVFLSLIVTF